MKNRLIALLLCFAMALSFVSPAWAVEDGGILSQEADSSFSAETSEADSAEHTDNEEMTDETEDAAAPDASTEADPNEAVTENAPDTTPVEEEEEEAVEEVSPEEEPAEEKPLEDTPAEEPLTTEEPLLETLDVTDPPAEENEEPQLPAIRYEVGETEILLMLGDVPSENFKQLQEAIKVGSQQRKPIRIAQAGVYTFAQTASTSKPIYLYPNTTLDLNGSTLVRGGSIGNLLCLTNENGRHSGAECVDYNMCVNVTVKNGTLDGAGGSGNLTNLVNIGHCTNVRFSNVNFRNGKGAHLLEFTGAKDCVVENCTFSGWIPVGSTVDPCEAIQIDLSYNGADKSWNGIYTAATDLRNAPCRNITITGCTFIDYPGGVGNHHTVNGAHNTGIRIVGNSFINSKDFKFNNGTNALQPAINCYAFDDVTVSNNTITGKYTLGIYVQGGSANITGNRIGASNRYFPAAGILGTKNLAWIPGNSNRNARINQYLANCSLSGNAIYCSANTPAVTFNTSSTVSSISKNTVVSSYYGLSLLNSTVGSIDGNQFASNVGSAFATSSTKVTNVSGNVFSSAGSSTVSLSGTSVTNFNSNRSTVNGGNAFYASGSSLSNILSNAFASSTGNAVFLSGSVVGNLNSNSIAVTNGNALAAASSTITNILGNTLSSTYGSSASFSGSKVAAFNSNRSTSAAGTALQLSASTFTNILSNAFSSVYNNAVYLSGSKVSAIKSNSAASNSASAFYLTNSTVTNLMTNNVSKAGKYGVYLTSKANVTNKLSSNVISSCGHSGIYATSNSKVKTVQSNKITGSKKYGIAILNKKIKVTVTKNTLKKNKKAVYIKAKGKKQKK